MAFADVFLVLTMLFVGLAFLALIMKRPAQVGTAATFAVIALVAFVLGIVETDKAKTVSASGPNGLQSAASTYW